MQPAARYAAAIDILDEILAGTPAEKALTGWARSHRFAGSKDRAALRDHVFDALRMQRSCATLGGAETGRGIIIGLCVRQGLDLESIFSGEGHAPAQLTDAERAYLPDDPASALAAMPAPIRLDVEDWIYDSLAQQFGAKTKDYLATQTQRAPVFLRVNTLKATPEKAQAALAKDGITTAQVSHIKTALEVIENERRIRNSEAFQSGLVELQDLSSQLSVSQLDLPKGARILDYCAGGGGKTLALAAHPAQPSALFAHDAAAGRMQDLPARAKRAGARVQLLQTDQIAAKGPFDLVFVDAPCSGSGTWRRNPGAKWRLTPDDLDRYVSLQAEILSQAAHYVTPGGSLCYATCALFDAENEAQITAFLARHPEWTLRHQWGADLSDRGDGFFCALMQRI
ncbi:MAG: RsmB/NOP family class I SAM-dependent RNA methyltransferase [Pseudomonadota bacterium]